MNSLKNRIPKTSFESAKAKAKRVFSDTRDVGNRVLEINKDYVMLYIPDFSRFMIDLNTEIIQNSSVDYQPERPIVCQEVERGIIAVDINTAVSDYVIVQGLESPDFFPSLLQRERSRRLAAEKHYRRARRQRTPENLERAYHSFIKYNRMRLDDIVPYWYLEELLESSKADKSMFFDLITPPQQTKNYLLAIREGMDDLAISKVAGIPIEGEIRKFIRDAGFLSITDLEEGRYEQAEFVRSEIGKKGKRYTREIIEEREKSYLSKRIRQHEYCESRHTFVNAAKKKDDSRQREELLDFIRLASDFNERNRIYRSHLLRIFRAYYKTKGKDCRRDSRQEAYA